MKYALAGLLGVSALAFAAPVAAQDGIPSGAYQLDPTHASVNVSVQHLGLSPYVMRFESFDMALTLDTENPANSSVTATIDPASVSTPLQDDGSFNAEIAGPGFLDSAAFPTIEFASTSVELTGETTATVTGDLTFMGVTSEISMEVELTGAIESHPFANAPAVGFVATGAFDRTVFGYEGLTQLVGNGASIVSPEVEFMISAEFIKTE